MAHIQWVAQTIDLPRYSQVREGNLDSTKVFNSLEAHIQWVTQTIDLPRDSQVREGSVLRNFSHFKVCVNWPGHMVIGKKTCYYLYG